MGVLDNGLPEYEGCIETPLSEKEKLLRDAFAEEYIKDFDRINAALRMGFDFAFADDFSLKFMQEGYVHRKIESLRDINPIIETPDRVAKDIANIRLEIAKNGEKDSDRLVACRDSEKSLWVSQGIENDKSTEWQGGVMLVHAIPSSTDWAAAAAASQAALKETVRE